MALRVAEESVEFRGICPTAGLPTFDQSADTFSQLSGMAQKGSRRSVQYAIWNRETRLMEPSEHIFIILKHVYELPAHSYACVQEIKREIACEKLRAMLSRSLCDR
jgi:hypothetical protein